MRTRVNCVAALLCLALVACECRAAQGATFVFDLTDSLGPEFSSFPETAVDLRTEFRRVDSATVEIEGTFSPGVVTPVTIPENTGPLLLSDTVNLLVRLGEVGTDWIDKNLFAIQDLQGLNGDVSFDLPLQGASTTTAPVLFPEGDATADFGFLLDGRFGIATGTTHWLASLYQELEPPRFQLTQFALQIEGTAVPEPTDPASALLCFLCAFTLRRKKSGDCTLSEL
jgi:hypothetical protein